MFIVLYAMSTMFGDQPYFLCIIVLYKSSIPLYQVPKTFENVSVWILKFL